MLYPRENEVRMVSDLSGIWEFKLGTENEPGLRIRKQEPCG